MSTPLSNAPLRHHAQMSSTARNRCSATSGTAGFEIRANAAVLGLERRTVQSVDTATFRPYLFC
jgi:hypothetical protein